jgi:hypothetical protein
MRKRSEVQEVLSSVTSNLLKNLFSKSRFWLARRRDALLQAATTFIARRRLSRNGPIEVLVDTSVLASAVLHESRWVSTGAVPWGEMRVDTGYLARVPVRSAPGNENPDHEHRDFLDSSYLTGIAHLARLGLIRLRSSGELEMEQWRQPAGRTKGHTLFARNAFEGIPIDLIDDLPPMVIGSSGLGLPSLKDQQRDRLNDSTDELFLGLRRRLGNKSSQDAWHIRTSEKHGMYCFLTTDHKLLANLDAQRQQEPVRSLKTKVLSPTQLGKALGLRPLSARYASHIDSSFPVREDLSMPGNRRKGG